MSTVRVTVAVRIDSDRTRVWRALTQPEEVRVWAAVEPVDVPADYPRPGQHARWRMRIAGVPLALHEHVAAVEAPWRYAAVLRSGAARVEEEYRLDPEGGATRLCCDNLVRARFPGLGPLAARQVRADVAGAMKRLRAWCERPPGPVSAPGGIPGTVTFPPEP